MKWIKSSTRKPTESVDKDGEKEPKIVLAWSKYKNNYVIGYFVGNDFCDNDDGIEWDAQITHWSYLLLPPIT